MEASRAEVRFTVAGVFGFVGGLGGGMVTLVSWR